MAYSLCFSFTPLTSIKPSSKPGSWINDTTQNCNKTKFQSFETKATDSNQSTKSNSIVCSNCDGNGAVQCSQCKGNGVNSIDYFNGQFKAGGLCWLCRGKKEILCGDCNGAGFLVDS